MDINTTQRATMLAYEAFLRSAAATGMPFMLKGSYVTRQYYKDPSLRIPADLDWVYMETLADAETAEKTFDEWAIAVTEGANQDGVQFTSFREDQFWRMIDYAMADDFPTVNTTLSCEVDGEMLKYLDLDVSFHLDIEVPPEPLLYTPLRGAPFTIPFTVPLSLQVSWKIHQTLVRPRFKDLLDLIHLLQHPSWNAEVLQHSVQALVNECAADRIDMKRLGKLIAGDLRFLYGNESVQEIWQYWRHEIRDRKSKIPYGTTAANFTDAGLLPESLEAFTAQLTMALQQGGWDAALLEHLPPVNRKLRPQYTQPPVVYSPEVSVPEQQHHASEEAREDAPLLLKPKRSFWQWLSDLFRQNKLRIKKPDQC